MQKHKSSKYTKYAGHETLVKQTINIENAEHAKEKMKKMQNIQRIQKIRKMHEN